MGGNAYGYNMQRLAQRMDPSATLPAPQQPQQYDQQQQDAQSSYGGKGGGMGGYGDYLGFGPQAPDFFQPVQGQEFQAEQPNPFDQGFNAQQERMAALERQLADLTSRQQNQRVDTGEVRADLPEPFEEFSVGQTEEETAAAEAEAAKPYQFYNYANLTAEQNAAYGADKKARSEYYASQTNKVKGDLDYAQSEYDKALESGDYAKISAARAQRDSINNTLNQIQTDAKAAARYKPPKTATGGGGGSGGGGGGSGRGNPQQNPFAAASQAAANQPSTGNTFQQNLLGAVGRGRTNARTRQNATTLNDARVQNQAKGGIIHKGMSSSLKKRLGTK
jgi:hypothetical protein